MTKLITFKSIVKKTLTSTRNKLDFVFLFNIFIILCNEDIKENTMKTLKRKQIKFVSIYFFNSEFDEVEVR